MLVGVDIGGTKTHIRWSRGGVDQDSIVPTADWRRTGNVEDAGVLLDLIKQGPAGALPSAIGIGAHSCDTERDCYAFAQALAALTPTPLRVVNDGELLPYAAGLDGGIGVVVGTGSIAVARRAADDVMLVAGGWGWILGDEGSAPAIVREAAKAIRESIDLGREPDGLYDALRLSLGTQSFAHFGRRLNELRGAVGWGEHASAVFEAAAAGSELAVGVIHRAAQALALLVERLVERGASPTEVVAAGGVVVAQPLLFRLFQDELHCVLPMTRLTLLREAPVGGAVAIARRLIDEAPEAMPGMAGKAGA
ncbi:MAG TPA: ATPase [Devosiaceae bacterium]|nr:ATPase [Devosiaceae bacterium]